MEAYKMDKTAYRLNDLEVDMYYLKQKIKKLESYVSKQPLKPEPRSQKERVAEYVKGVETKTELEDTFFSSQKDSTQPLQL
jgi:hypothetical protein